MQPRINTAAYLHIGYGILIVLIGILVFVILTGSGWISGDRTAIAVTSGLGIFFIVLFLVLSLPSLLAGYGLLHRREWGRVLAFIMSIIHLFSFPIGTAIGAYTLWAISNDELRTEFS